MFKPIERMHSRSTFVQIGPTCMGEHLVASYRTLKDAQTGETFCMMMRWMNYDKLKFNVQKTDELMHLFFGDTAPDRSREEELEKHGDIQLDKTVLQSAVYRRVYHQLLRDLNKRMNERGYRAGEDLTICKL